MLRVLHVVARMPPNGTERQLAGVLRAAHGRLWDAQLCVLYPGFSLTAELRADGIPTTELKGRPWSPGRAARLRRLSRSGVDVVHSSLWGANAYTRLAVGGPGRPAVVVAERRVEDYRGRPRRGLDAVLRPGTDLWLANSPAVASFVARAHGVAPDDVVVVPNGLDRDVFRPGGEDRAAGDPIRIGSVGRLIEQKGYDVLLDALPTLLRRRTVEVLLAGEGEERPRLERAAAGLPVRFVGRLPTPADVARFLRSLDLFVLPSRYEGLPNAALEALASGVRVVATDAAGFETVLPHLAAVARSGDSGSLAAALDAALSAPPPRPPEIPSFEEVANRHLQAFEQALAHRRNRRRPSGAH